jgi:hypothetical protein
MNLAALWVRFERRNNLMGLPQNNIDLLDKKGLEFTFIDNDNTIVYFTSKYGLKEYVQVNGVNLASQRVKSSWSSGLKFSLPTGEDYEVIAKIRSCEYRLYKNGQFVDGYKITHKRIAGELERIIPIVALVFAFVVLLVYHQLFGIPVAFLVIVINKMIFPRRTENKKIQLNE